MALYVVPDPDPMALHIVPFLTRIVNCRRPVLWVLAGDFIQLKGV